jgi:hypothetical protein
LSDDPYLDLKEHFADVTDVTVNAGRGSQGLKFGKKMFAMFYKGDLVVTLSPERVSELVESGEGLPFDPGTGTPMKNRVLVPATESSRWLDFCEESAEYARAGGR